MLIMDFSQPNLRSFNSAISLGIAIDSRGKQINDIKQRKTKSNRAKPNRRNEACQTSSAISIFLVLFFFFCYIVGEKYVKQNKIAFKYDTGATTFFVSPLFRKIRNAQLKKCSQEQ